MISCCIDSQVSIDTYINNKYQGMMTIAFLDALNKNSNLTWKQLIINMRAFLKNTMSEQIPQLSSGKLLNIDSKFDL